MHNVRKVKTSEDKMREKIEQSKKKATEYVDLQKKVLDMRAQGQYSMEALKATTQLLNLSADCYSVWNFRKLIITQLDITSPESKESRYREELKWTESLLPSHPKSYWIWFHRKWITMRVTNMDWQRELSLCTRALDLDNRNFHCWNYRHYVAEQAKVTYSSELDYTMTKIEQNFSNYSSWHQRSYLLQKLFEDDPSVVVQKLNEELDLVQNAFYTTPDDQSSWFYYRWLIGMQKKHNEINFKDVVKNELEKVKALLEEEPNSKWPMLTIVFLLIELGDNKNEIKEKLILLQKIDPQRKAFYQYQMDKFL